MLYANPPAAGAAAAADAADDFQLTIQTSHAAVVVLLHRGRSNMVRQCIGLSQTSAAAAATADHGAPASNAQAADVDSSNAASSSSSSGYDVSGTAGSCQLGLDRSGNEVSEPSSSSSRQQEGSETANVTAAAAATAAESNVLLAAVFDPVRSHRVFGVTADGDLLTLAVPAAQRNYCKVRSRFLEARAHQQHLLLLLLLLLQLHDGLHMCLLWK